MPAIYDTIGQNYTATRTADPRIVTRLVELLDLPTDSRVLDVGAGTGNYSQALAEADYQVTALEPSEVMRNQGKRHGSLSWVAGTAEELPFKDNSFDAVVMTLCMHHFSDWKKGLAEARRVAGKGPIVILTFDVEFDSGFWLFDYFPGFLEKDKAWFPRITELSEFVEQRWNLGLQIHRFALPPDLVDHFAAAGWARPDIYLNETYRSGISSFSSVDQKSIDAGLRRLAEDLDSGSWDSKYGKLRKAQSLDVGYVFLRIGGQ